MSEENVELTRHLVDAWNRQDPEGMLALIDSDAEYVNASTAVEPGTRRGHDAAADVMRRQWEGVPDALLEIDRFHDRGDEIISEGRISRPMPGTDERISTLVLTWKFRDGKLIRLEVLGTGPEFAGALEAAGLSE